MLTNVVSEEDDEEDFVAEGDKPTTSKSDVIIIMFCTEIIRNPSSEAQQTRIIKHDVMKRDTQKSSSRIWGGNAISKKCLFLQKVAIVSDGEFVSDSGTVTEKARSG